MTWQRTLPDLLEAVIGVVAQRIKPLQEVLLPTPYIKAVI